MSVLLSAVWCSVDRLVSVLVDVADRMVTESTLHGWWRSDAVCAAVGVRQSVCEISAQRPSGKAGSRDGELSCAAGQQTRACCRPSHASKQWSCVSLPCISPSLAPQWLLCC